MIHLEWYFGVKHTFYLEMVLDLQKVPNIVWFHTVSTMWTSYIAVVHISKLRNWHWFITIYKYPVLFGFLQLFQYCFFFYFPRSNPPLSSAWFKPYFISCYCSYTNILLVDFCLICLFPCFYFQLSCVLVFNVYLF